jgi:hypothetical protein
MLSTKDDFGATLLAQMEVKRKKKEK